MTETTFMEPIFVTHESKKNRLKSQLDATILQAVDESLATFGESVKQVVYFQLQNHHNIGKIDIPSRIEEFAAAIEEVFGFGARLIEMKIMEALYSKANGFSYRPRGEDLLFKDYVETVRSFLSTTLPN